MCELARLNGERVQPGPCCNNPTLDTGPVLPAKLREARLADHARYCTKRSELLRRRGTTWFQIERPLEPSDICNGTFHGTLLRHPLKVASSQVRFVRAPRKLYQRHLYCVSHGTKACNAAKDSGHSHCGRRFHCQKLWAFFDNFMVRSLGGHAIFDLPPGGVNRSHLHAVQKILERFDLVETVEKLSSGPELARAFRDHFGWTEFGLMPSSPESIGVKANANGAREDNSTFSATEQALIRSQSRYDFELYEWAASANSILRGRRRSQSQKRTAEVVPQMT